MQTAGQIPWLLDGCFQTIHISMTACLQDTIAKALVRALQSCPDVVPMRKELLVAAISKPGLLDL